MQINEITRRKLNEVGFAAGLATGLQGALSKVGVQGPALEPSQYTGPVMNRAQALAQAQKQAQTLIPVMQKNWAKTVQAALAQSTDPVTRAPATGVDKMTTGDQSSLKASLIELVNTVIFRYPGQQYKNLPNSVGEDLTTKAQAMQVVQDIDKAVDTIFQGTMDKSANVQQAWTSLGTNGIAPAQAIAVRDAGTVGSSSVRAKPGGKEGEFEVDLGNGVFVPYDPKNPAHKKVAEKQKNQMDI